MKINSYDVNSELIAIWMRLTAMIFISHSSQDNVFVRRLAASLKELGVSVWLDLEQIENGERWIQELQTGLEQAEALIVVISRAARESEWVEREVLYSLERRKPVFIVLTETLPLPLYLVNRQYSDFTTGYEHGLKNLLAVLRKKPPQPVTTNVSADANADNFFDYLAQIAEGKALALVARDLYRWSQKQGQVEFTGKFQPAFHLRVPLGEKDLTVLSVFAYLRNPALQIPFDYLSKYPPYTDLDLRLEVLKDLSQLLPEDENFTASRANRRPTIPLNYLLGDAERLERLKQVVSQIIQRLKQENS